DREHVAGAGAVATDEGGAVAATTKRGLEDAVDVRRVVEVTGDREGSRVAAVAALRVARLRVPGVAAVAGIAAAAAGPVAGRGVTAVGTGAVAAGPAAGGGVAAEAAGVVAAGGVTAGRIACGTITARRISAPST